MDLNIPNYFYPRKYTITFNKCYSYISQDSGNPCFENDGKGRAPNLNEIEMVGPKQSVSPSALNKNGKYDGGILVNLEYSGIIHILEKNECF